MCDTLVTSFSSSSSKLTSCLGNLRLTAVERRTTNSSSPSSSTSAILANAIDILRYSDGFLNCALYVRSAVTIKLTIYFTYPRFFFFFFRKNDRKKRIIIVVVIYTHSCRHYVRETRLLDLFLLLVYVNELRPSELRMDQRSEHLKEKKNSFFLFLAIIFIFYFERENFFREITIPE